MRIDRRPCPINRATDTMPPMIEPTPFQRRLPNLLTLLRVAIAAVFFALLSLGMPIAAGPRLTPMADDRVVLLTAAGLFILAALTDALDGHLARKWSVVSKFGRVMDPFADKLLVLGAFIYLASPAFLTVDPSRPDAAPFAATGVAIWMVVAIVGRELLVTSIRGVAESAGANFSATWSGKWKMILQSIVVPVVLVTVAFVECGARNWARWMIDILVWATVLVTIWSAVPYVRRGMRVLNDVEVT